jgi:phage replication initiation protein
MLNTDYLIYDYFTFTTKIHTVTEIVELLGLSDLKAQRLKGFYRYKDRLYYDGISIHFNGPVDLDMGVCVEMSGTGCRTFESYGTGDYIGLFNLILQYYDDESSKRKMNITRLDVAYDDFSGVLDLPLLCTETQKLNFVSRFKDWQVITGNKGISVNHGSNKSNVYIRIYDKRLEQNMQDIIPHWVRFEIQMRKECALGFLMLQGDINQNFYSTLNQYLRYTVPGLDSNPSMRDTAPYWLNFIQSAESKAIFHKPAQNYSFDKLYTYVNSQLSGAIKTYITVVGVPQFLLDVNQSQKGKQLNPKYQKIIDESEEEPTDILDYLQKHNLL